MKKLFLVLIFVYIARPGFCYDRTYTVKENPNDTIQRTMIENMVNNQQQRRTNYNQGYSDNGYNNVVTNNPNVVQSMASYQPNYTAINAEKELTDYQNKSDLEAYKRKKEIDLEYQRKAQQLSEQQQSAQSEAAQYQKQYDNAFDSGLETLKLRLLPSEHQELYNLVSDIYVKRINNTPNYLPDYKDIRELILKCYNERIKSS